ncbi:hypothetical protein KP509_20G019300 [Ceratopteris richardii]|nr:hypothetical protein KP509_20G019300 [Ceratopteris richardii]
MSMLSCKLVIAHNDSSVVHTIIWSGTFSECQMGEQHTLSFLQNGNLVVFRVSGDGTPTNLSSQNGEGTIVWESSTTRDGVSTMELQNNGNLVLLNYEKEPMWNSFAHPASTLVSGQVLHQGMSLTLIEGIYKYSLTIKKHRAALYVMDTVTQDQKPYWELLPNSSINPLIAFAAVDEAGNLQLYDSDSKPLVLYEEAAAVDAEEEGEDDDFSRTLEHQNAAAEFRSSFGDDKQRQQPANSKGVREHQDSARPVGVHDHEGGLWRLELTSTVIGAGGGVVKHGGNIEVYKWEGENQDGETESVPSWNLQWRALPRRCELPNACPSYKTCVGGWKCRDITTWLSSRAESGSDESNGGWCGMENFVEVKNTSYFAAEVGRREAGRSAAGGGREGSLASLAECRMSCVRDCSCAAFVYRGYGTLSCYTIRQPPPPLAVGSPLSTLSFITAADSASVFLRSYQSSEQSLHSASAPSSSSPSHASLTLFLFTLSIAFFKPLYGLSSLVQN